MSRTGLRMERENKAIVFPVKRDSQKNNIKPLGHSQGSFQVHGRDVQIVSLSRPLLSKKKMTLNKILFEKRQRVYLCENNHAK